MWGWLGLGVNELRGGWLCGFVCLGEKVVVVLCVCVNFVAFCLAELCLLACLPERLRKDVGDDCAGGAGRRA